MLLEGGRGCSHSFLRPIHFALHKNMFSCMQSVSQPQKTHPSCISPFRWCPSPFYCVPVIQFHFGDQSQLEETLLRHDYTAMVGGLLEFNLSAHCGGRQSQLMYTSLAFPGSLLPPCGRIVRRRWREPRALLTAVLASRAQGLCW